MCSLTIRRLGSIRSSIRSKAREQLTLAREQWRQDEPSSEYSSSEEEGEEEEGEEEYGGEDGVMYDEDGEEMEEGGNGLRYGGGRW